MKMMNLYSIISLDLNDMCFKIVLLGFKKMYLDPMSHRQRELKKFTWNIVLLALSNCKTLSQYKIFTKHNYACD